ncbi:hypothetical protein D7Y04_39935 [Corallococcus sp. AB038B]|nr:hypothetical protein D7Y04_39935 [Corallococcus sp. AB038B]
MPKELEEVRRIALGEESADEAQVRAALAQAWAWLAPLTSALPSVGPSSSVPKYATGDVERWFRAVVARTNGSTETVMARMLRDAALEGAKVPGLVEDNAALVDALKELADLMEGVRDGSYTPDSFTLQVAHRLLAEEHPGAALLAEHEAKVSALQALVAELEGELEQERDNSRTLASAGLETEKQRAELESERDALRAQVGQYEKSITTALRMLAEGQHALVESNLRLALSTPPAETTPGPNSPTVPEGSTAPTHRMLSPLDVRPAVPPLLPVSERIQQSLAKLGHEPTPLTTSAVDALHPSGRCTCTGEGTCAWCRARCDACGSPYIPEAVRHSLAQVWSALRITTAHQGVAVAVLRAVYPELPVPNARAGADILPAWNALAQAVTEAARLGAEDMRNQAARHIAGLVLAGQDPFSFARELDALPLLLGEEVPRG